MSNGARMQVNSSRPISPVGGYRSDEIQVSKEPRNLATSRIRSTIVTRFDHIPDEL